MKQWYEPYRGNTLFVLTTPFDVDIKQYKYYVNKADGTTTILDVGPFWVLTETLFHKMIDIGCPTRENFRKDDAIEPIDIEVAWDRRFAKPIQMF